MAPRENYQRISSTEVTVREILNGELIQTDEWSQNYLLTENATKIYFVNMMGVILRKEPVGTITNLWLDDGTGQIVLRFFEEHKKAEGLKIGNVVLVIGKLRVYNQEKYISPEIINRVDPLWLKIRSLKLQLVKGILPGIQTSKLTETVVNGRVEEEIVAEEIKNEKLLPTEKITKLIAELDQGNGVPIELVIERSLLGDTEQVLKRMLEKGDIFQNAPGKVKVL